jgi:hypothetical protein
MNACGKNRHSKADYEIELRAKAGGHMCGLGADQQRLARLAVFPSATFDVPSQEHYKSVVLISGEYSGIAA